MASQPSDRPDALLLDFGGVIMLTSKPQGGLQTAAEAVAARLAQANDPVFEAIICFGAIFQGKTSHAQNIADSVSHSLADLQIHSGKPIIHGVLLFQDEEQARIRCFGKDHNRGIEAARTAIEMIRVMRSLQNFERELLD